MPHSSYYGAVDQDPGVLAGSGSVSLKRLDPAPVKYLQWKESYKWIYQIGSSSGGRIRIFSFLGSRVQIRNFLKGWIQIQIKNIRIRNLVHTLFKENWRVLFLFYYEKCILKHFLKSEFFLLKINRTHFSNTDHAWFIQVVKI